ncbi:hypothetical protein KM043_013311 [Ampulex compressa]|nr:hypothetical protein KM043_013311 [Ampulex compressa]
MFRRAAIVSKRLSLALRGGPQGGPSSPEFLLIGRFLSGQLQIVRVVGMRLTLSRPQEERPCRRSTWKRDTLMMDKGKSRPYFSSRLEPIMPLLGKSKSSTLPRIYGRGDHTPLPT